MPGGAGNVMPTYVSMFGQNINLANCHSVCIHETFVVGAHCHNKKVKSVRRAIVCYERGAVDEKVCL